MFAFGPVPSRRLGHSLGINNIPPKVCTYACVYCQIGRTSHLRHDRQVFYAPEEIVQDVECKVTETRERGNAVDFLSFVPDGEPTLDVNLGREIDLLRFLKIPIAVISNASLISREDVRRDLSRADWVSLKMDAVTETAWRKTDRPHGQLELSAILEGALEFSRTFKGRLVTETMLVSGLNDTEEVLRQTAHYLAKLGPETSYISIPTRPPAESRVRPPDARGINRAFQIFREQLEHVELITGYEGNAFSATGDLATDLLGIMAVHPMRRDAIDEILKSADKDWSLVEDLIERRLLVETVYQGYHYFLRQFNPVES
jgi:wyosine [tRNA(Phe)-imidazoG37] synthetase (radical SAM superfamily)